MKTKNTLFFVLFSISLPVLHVSAQQAPNPGFETWNTVGSYSDPQSWDTPNKTTAVIPLVGTSVVTKANGAHGGSWCAELQTKTIVGNAIPGVITTGTLTINLAALTFTLTGGAPFTQRPSSMDCYYKFTTPGGDTCLFGVLLTKRTAPAVLDTIGYGVFMTNTAASGWTLLNIPITYLSALDPDTLNITIISSANTVRHAGTNLFVDDITMNYSAGIEQLSNAPDFELAYHNDTHVAELQFNYKRPKDVSIRLYDLTGQLVQSRAFNAVSRNSKNLSLENLKSGLYILEVLADGQKTCKKIIR